jgi:hypothetical protein
MATKRSLDKLPETPEQKKMRDMEKELAELKKMIQENSANQKQIQPQFYQQVPTDDSIPFNRQVRVMSLCPNKLNLSTEKGGKGHHYTFERFGETKKISYGDLVAIGENHRNFKEAGFYYILDDKVVEEEGLSDIYASILNKQRMEQVLSNSADAVSMFQKTNPKQQKNIVDMIVGKLLAGEYIDQNLIVSIDRILNPQNDKNYVGINDRVNNVNEINNIKPENQ